MRIESTFRNIEDFEHLRSYTQRRFARLDRFFGKHADLTAQVNYIVDKHRQRIEVFLSGSGFDAKAEEESKDMYASVDLVVDKLAAQIKKYISKNRDKWRTTHGKPTNFDIYTYKEPAPANIVDRGDVHYSSVPITKEEAAIQLDAKGDEFLVFRNVENERINVIYHRKNGDYGLIDPAV